MLSYGQTTMDPRNEDGLVGVAYANDRVEAEMIQGLLEGAGIPSVLQHSVWTVPNSASAG